MQTIKLRRTSWEYDSSVVLGPPGGFGTVYQGFGKDGKEVAVKKLHISAASAGNRELAISEEFEGQPFSHIIPFYDSGIDADSLEYFVVMAKAERSLQDLVNQGPVPETDAITILTDIALALDEAKMVVHRDLKPGNVLYHENKWKLADFGIARFVEDSTSRNTLKDCLSKLYAAPEQWRFERATKATDVCAFGCVAFALLTGLPPFTTGDLRQRHLNEDPPQVSASIKMRLLVSLCLRKSPSARPSVDSILKQLGGVVTVTTPANRAIAAAGAAIAEEEARREAESSVKHNEEQARRDLARDALDSLSIIVAVMLETIENHAPNMQRLSDRHIGLGSGKLKIEVPFPFLTKEAFSNSGRNIICGALITVEQDTAYYRGRAANLWFGDFGNGEFHWWEIPYFQWQGNRRGYEPFGIVESHELLDADYAAAPITHSVQHASEPRRIDGEYSDAFIERWTTRLAEASRNRLQRPGSLPER